jgi:hypothetical protein
MQDPGSGGRSPFGLVAEPESAHSDPGLGRENAPPGSARPASASLRSGADGSANGPRQSAGGRRPIRLSGSGRLVGFAYLDEPQRADIGRQYDSRQPLSLVAPHGEVRGLTEVADEDVRARDGRGFPGSMAQDRHSDPLL